VDVGVLAFFIPGRTVVKQARSSLLIAVLLPETITYRGAPATKIRSQSLH
jgi:hypothetical protein